jgi:hypothetical protein
MSGMYLGNWHSVSNAQAGGRPHNAYRAVDNRKLFHPFHVLALASFEHPKTNCLCSVLGGPKSMC